MNSAFCAGFQNLQKNHVFWSDEKYFFCNHPNTPKICHDLRRAQRLGLRQSSGAFPTHVHPRPPTIPLILLGHSPRLPAFRPEFQFPFPPPIPLTDIPLTVPIQTFSALLWVFCAIPILSIN